MLERDESFVLRIDDSSLSLDTVTLDANNDEATVTILNDDSKLCSGILTCLKVGMLQPISYSSVAYCN